MSYWEHTIFNLIISSTILNNIYVYSIIKVSKSLNKKKNIFLIT